MPDHEKLRAHPHLNKIFGKLLHDPNLLHLNRRSVSGAFFVGLFMAFVPLPTQMIFAAGVAIWLRVNLPISVGLVWITNPITIPPMFYFAYKVGAWILNEPVMEWQFELSWDWFLNTVHLRQMGTLPTRLPDMCLSGGDFWLFTDATHLAD